MKMGDYSYQRQDSDPFNEKLAAYSEPTSPIRAYIPTGRDPEKVERLPSDQSVFVPSPCSDRMSAVRIWENMPRSEHKNEGLAKTLAHLSLSNPIVATLFSFYSIIVTILVLMFGFVRSIGKDGISIKDQLIRALAPAIRYELRLINTEVDLYSRCPLSVGRLLGVLFISPFFSLGVMLAAWTTVAFWCYTTILGEPNQKQGKEVDGKSAARWVKQIWERWLLMGL